MIDWFETLSASRALPEAAGTALLGSGFVVLPGLVPPERLVGLTNAYNSVMEASSPDLRIGTTSTRVSDLVNRGAAFDALYTCPPLLDACCRVIRRPFKLSSLTARTVRPRVPAQELHVDVERSSADWPLLGFILMIDAFRPDNGATRLVPGSHRWVSLPEDPPTDLQGPAHAEVLAYGTPGSVLVFDGSVWHGHSANTSDTPRRSIQGAFIPRGGQAAIDFGRRMQPETRARLSALAQYVLAA
jgi:Phytanoyl-CoA dioxygenase (PhyH)